MRKFEKEILEFVSERYLVLGFLIVTLFALMMRICMFQYMSNDYTVFLSRWFDYMKENGGLLALGTYPGNYNAPYMTIIALLTYLPFNSLYSIKVVSILFDFGLALSAGALVKYIVPKNKSFYFFLTYSVMLFVPEFVLNSAVWGQCDAGYSMFVILALLYLLKGKYLKSFIFLGISFALKLQFIFILPLYVVLYLVKKEFSIWNFLIIPLVNFILCLPAIILGKPITELALVYFKQVGEYREFMGMNFINIYGILASGSGRILYAFGTFATLFVCLMMLIYIIYKKVKFDDKKILNLGLWFVVVTTFLLPCMHDRYLYLGCALAVIYMILYKENFVLMISIMLCSILTYYNYLFKINFDQTGLVVLGYTFVIAYYTRNLLRMLDDRV